MEKNKDMRNRSSDIREEYFDFVNSSSHEIPLFLYEGIIKSIYLEQNKVSSHFVLFKFFITQLFAGGVALMFCPQIKFSLTYNLEVFHYFHHRFGANACSFICALLFLGVSSILCLSVISKDQIEQIKSNRYFLLVITTAILAGSFIFFGVEKYTQTVLLWAIGAFLGQLSGTKINFISRSFIR